MTAGVWVDACEECARVLDPPRPCPCGHQGRPLRAQTWERCPHCGADLPSEVHQWCERCGWSWLVVPVPLFSWS